MLNTPVRKHVNPLTPIIHTVGALLIKQTSGELCIPKATPFLVVCLVMCALTEIGVVCLKVTPQAEYALLLCL